MSQMQIVKGPDRLAIANAIVGERGEVGKLQFTVSGDRHVSNVIIKPEKFEFVGKFIKITGKGDIIAHKNMVVFSGPLMIEYSAREGTGHFDAPDIKCLF